MIPNIYRANPVWAAKQERAMARVATAERDGRTLMRTFFPQIAPQRDGVAASHCRVCDPAPKVFTCPACDWQTEERWRFGLHLSTNPGWCKDRAAKKIRKWASKA